MRARVAWFVLSCVLALALYAALFAAAPRIVLLRAPQYAEAAARPITLRLRPADRLDPTTVSTPLPRTLLSRPGSVRDLIARALPPPDLPPRNPTPGPQAVAAPEAPAPPDAPQTAGAAVEAELLALSRDALRSEVDVSRRVVRPSATRIAPADAAPSNGGIAPPAEDDRLRAFTAAARSLLTEPIDTEDFRPLTPRPAEPPADAPPSLNELDRLHVRAREELTSRMRAEQAERYAFLDDALAYRLTTYIPPDGSPGYFTLDLQVRDDAPLAPLPLAITYVLDASQSILQRKLDLAVRGVLASLAQLSPSVRANVIYFRETSRALREMAAPVDPGLREAAAAMLEGLEARGETDVYSALKSALSTPPPSGHAGIVFAFTDGRPTTGIQDARSIINALGADAHPRNHLVAIGSGNTVDAFLLDLLAYRCRGEAHTVAAIERTDEAVPRLIGRMVAPMVIEVRVQAAGTTAEQVHPRAPGALYRGRALRFAGRFPPDAPRIAVEVTGQTAGGPAKAVLALPVAEAEPGGADIAQQWAYRRALWLVSTITQQGNRPEWVAALEGINAKYGLDVALD